MSPTPKPGEVWRGRDGKLWTALKNGAWRGNGMTGTATGLDGWTRVLMADGSVPPEVRRALRIEGATSTYAGTAPSDPEQLKKLAAVFVDARWPEDAP
jgi:hypothetical protein